MKRLVISCAAAVALLAGPALAADLPEPYEPIAPEVYGPTVFNWTGAYIGTQLGYSWGNINGNFPGAGNATIDKDGVAGGFYGGYNYQVAPNFVIGGEADITWADLQGNRRMGGFDYKTRTTWTGSLRARAGLAFDRFMVYGTGGLAFANNNVERAGFGSESKNAVGWTLGAGVEGAITQNIVARGEYIYQAFGDQDYNKLGVKDVDFNTNVVRAGVAYKF